MRAPACTLVVIASTLVGTTPLLAYPLLGQAQAKRRQAPATYELTPDQLRGSMAAEIVINQLEASADMVEAAQRACDGRWRYRAPDALKSYTLEIAKLRFTRRHDTGEIEYGLADPADEMAVQLIDDGTTGDVGAEQHFLECNGRSALLTWEHVGDDVKLARMPSASPPVFRNSRSSRPR